MRTRHVMVTAALVVLSSAGLLSQRPQVAAPSSSADLRTWVDDAARRVLADSGVPSASVAIVKDGQIVYLQAYGEATLAPRTEARPTMRYSIGSVSKQFTAAAMLMLQEQGKLRLDDRVSRYLPDLTQAGDVSLRQLLSHTSGYQDYWPQDYVPPFMLKEITARKIMDLWARKPLDFAPGAKWQYSNTNYVIAGVIIEQVAGKPLLQFLRERVFVPLGMTSVVNIDQERLAESDPTGYQRYALGPLRPAPKEGKGWLFAAGELAMTAEDLAKWDISMMAQTLMTPSSYREMQTDTLLASGLATGYGLGVSVTSQGGRRLIEHNGEVSGFCAENMTFPDDRAAIVVLTNQDAAGAHGAIARQVVPALFPSADSAAPGKAQQAWKIFEELQQGKIDRSLFTDNANAYFSEQALADFAASLGPLGRPTTFAQASQQLRGGMTLRVYTVRCGTRTLRVWTYEMPDGKLEQFQVAPA